MIYVKLTGGLGNQIFQYAIARNLAHQHGATVGLDRSFFSEQYRRQDVVGYRRYGLSAFRITGQLLSLDQEEWLNAPFKSHRLGKLIRWPSQRLGLGCRPRYIGERDYRFDRGVLNAPASTYLVGFWQSYKYFEAIEMIIREELSFVAPPAAEVECWLDEILGCNAVSLHVRRGDYANPAVVGIHGLVDKHFYMRAIEALVKTERNMRVFVFSDDLAWAKEYLKIDECEMRFVEYPDQYKLPHEDLRLMSHCHHHILANSSFSWWGAWLNSSEKKNVIAPAQWFADGRDTRDLLPPNWRRF